ncbi:hypothetical protein Tco_1578855 [Tanacetum coccineum]
MGVKNLQANVDSRLVANQVNGSYVAKESVPRIKNKKADALSKIASTSFAHLSKQVLVEELKEKSIHKKEVLAIVEEEEQTWMKPICNPYVNTLQRKSFQKTKKSQGGMSQGIPVHHYQWNFIQEIFLGTVAPVRRATSSKLRP